MADYEQDLTDALNRIERVIQGEAVHAWDDQVVPIIRAKIDSLNEAIGMLDHGMAEAVQRWADRIFADKMEAFPVSNPTVRDAT